MNPPTLRPYQTQLIRDLYQCIDDGHSRIALIAGTGAGKTVISGQICADIHAQSARLMFLVHMDVLVQQTHEKLRAFGLPCGFIKANYPEVRSAPIQIASIQTMAQRRWWRRYPADVIFYDEAHLTLFSKVGKEVLYRTHPNSIHIAMTATPERLGKDQLGEHLETFVAAPPPADLQAMGFLAKMRYFEVPPPDLSKVRTAGGDFDARGLKNACDRPELIAKIVQEWRRLAPGKRTIAFCIDTAHAQHVAAAFRDSGIPAAAVEGKTPIDERKRLYAALRDQRIMVLTSCNVISIGFDEPSVEVGLLLRPTQSHALHIQQIGRVMRISPNTGKVCGLILDQAGNLDRLGYPEDIRDYFLPMKRGGRQGETSNKTCPNCSRSQPNFVLRCGCGYTWESGRKARLDDLVEVYSRSQAQQITDPEILRDLYHKFRRRIFLSGYHIRMADEQFFQHTGRHPQPEWQCHSIFPEATQDARAAFFDYLNRCAQSGGEGDAWVRQSFDREFGLATAPYA